MKNLYATCFKKFAILCFIFMLFVMLTACNDTDALDVSVPQMLNVTITLDYESVPLTSNTPMNVYVGDEKLGRQEAGTIQDYSISLEEGKYAFYLKNDGIYKTDEIMFEVTDDQYIFSFGAKTRLTFGVKVWEN